ncbi:MAG: peroxiredoxin family protein [Chitinophagales bacterium]
MKILMTVLFILLLTIQSASQNEFQKCADNKNAIVSRLLKKGKLDSADQKKYLELDDEWQKCIVGKSMPSFNSKTLNGEEINSKELRGKIVVINFWFIGCPPCIAEMPALNQLVKEYKDKGVSFLGFTVENKKSLKKRFFPKYQFDFTIIPDATEIEDLFGVLEHPMIFIIDQNCKVIAAWGGGEAGEKAKTYVYLKIKPVLDGLLKIE